MGRESKLRIVAHVAAAEQTVSEEEASMAELGVRGLRVGRAPVVCAVGGDVRAHSVDRSDGGIRFRS